MPNKPIDAVRAAALYRQLGSWRLVGEALAREMGRPIRFQAYGVRNAVERRKKKVLENVGG